MTNNDLAIYEGIEPMLALAAKLKGATGLIPEHIKTEGQLLATMLAGRELGIGPMAALRGLHVVRGKVGADYSLWVALLKRNGYSVEWLESSAKRVVLRLTDPKGIQHTEVWDEARAKQAGLWGGGEGWKKYPETMLRARAVTSAGRAFAAEVMAGGYSLDEIDEIAKAEPPPTGPARVAQRITIAATESPTTITPEQVPLDLLVEELVELVRGAVTLDDLDAIPKAAHHLKGADKATFADAYRTRKVELKAQAENDAEALAEREAIQSETEYQGGA